MSESKPETSETEPTEKPRRAVLRWTLRQTRRLIVLLGVGLLLFVVGFAIYAWQVNARGDRAVDQIEKRLAERGLLELYWEYSDTDNEGWYSNATNAKYWRAAMQAAPEAGELPLLSVGTVWVNDIEHKQQYHPDMVSALRDVFEQHPRFLELISDAIEAPPGRFGIGNDFTDPAAGLDVLGQSRSVARWLEERSRLAVIDQDSEMFVWTIKAILELNNLLDQETQASPSIVSGSIDALASDAVMDALSRIELRTEQLDDLIAAFQRRQTSRDIVQLVGHDLSWQFHYISSDVPSYLRLSEAKQSLIVRQLAKTEPDWFDASRLPGSFEIAWQNALLTTCPGRYELRHTKLINRSIDCYDELKALEDKPKARWAWIRTTLNQVEAQEDSRASDQYYSRAMYDINVLYTTRTFLMMQSNTATVIAALEVERYRIKQGTWPNQLEDATGELPFDLFGKSLGYRMTPEGVKVYTKGYNTRDERGYGQFDDDVPSRFSDADDWAFVLYNPELRNSIPPPDEAIDPDYDASWEE